MSEFVSATDRLSRIHPAVSIFGSARTRPNQPYYKLTEEIARLLSDAGFSVISGGGPGIMEGRQQGRVLRQIAQRRAEHSTAKTSSPATSTRTSARPSSIFSRAK